MDSVWKQIGAIAEENSGIITTAQVEAAGISRTALKRYVDEKQLIRVCKGLYVLEKGMVDEYALLQARSGKALYSYGTALFLWGLSDRVPHTLDLTVPHGTNVSKIKRDNPQIRRCLKSDGRKLNRHREAQYGFMIKNAVSVI